MRNPIKTCTRVSLAMALTGCAGVPSGVDGADGVPVAYSRTQALGVEGGTYVVQSDLDNGPGHGATGRRCLLNHGPQGAMAWRWGLGSDACGTALDADNDWLLDNGQAAWDFIEVAEGKFVLESTLEHGPGHGAAGRKCLLNHGPDGVMAWRWGLGSGVCGTDAEHGLDWLLDNGQAVWDLVEVSPGKFVLQSALANGPGHGAAGRKCLLNHGSDGVMAWRWGLGSGMCGAVADEEMDWLVDNRQAIWSLHDASDGAALGSHEEPVLVPWAGGALEEDAKLAIRLRVVNRNYHGGTEAWPRFVGVVNNRLDAVDETLVQRNLFDVETYPDAHERFGETWFTLRMQDGRYLRRAGGGNFVPTANKDAAAIFLRNARYEGDSFRVFSFSWGERAELLDSHGHYGATYDTCASAFNVGRELDGVEQWLSGPAPNYGCYSSGDVDFFAVY